MLLSSSLIYWGEMEHLEAAFCRMGLGMVGGGAGGIGRGPLGTTSTATATAGGSAETGSTMEATTSWTLCVTVTPELCLAMRGSLRVIVLTEDTACVMTGAGV